MNYEKIIVELLGRIQVLEEQVSALMAEREGTEVSKVFKVTTDDVRAYIMEQKRLSKEMGKTVLVLRAGDIHNDLGLKQRHPMVCNAMRSCMSSEDVILYQPPKGNGPTLRIEYKL